MHRPNTIGLKRIGRADTLLDKVEHRNGEDIVVRSKGWANCGDCRRRRPHVLTVNCQTSK